MSKDLKILQIGTENWKHRYEIPKKMEWYYFYPNSPKALKETIKMDEIRKFNAILIEDGRYLVDLLPIIKIIEPYTIFYNQEFQTSNPLILDLIKKRCAQAVDFSEPQKLLKDLSTSLFGGGYGDKLNPSAIDVHPSFKGSISYQGFEYLLLEGDFGSEFSPVANWKYNFVSSTKLPIELWLEYEKSEGVEFQFRVKKMPEGSVSGVVEDLLYTEEDLKTSLIMDQDYNSYLCMSVEARGQGTLKLGNLHQRWTRKYFGKYVLGGNILHDHKRDEINYFFHPGDFKPPLAVYFAGFRSAEGFEGYWMMQNFKCPFILFSDPRLEGGAFYIGSEDLEEKIKQTIRHYQEYLGFDKKDLILSGLSMGTFPSLYYGSFFEPKGIVVGKPLANLGTIARRGRLEAPGVFPTAFDVLHHQTGGISPAHMDELDNRFWSAFKQADFSQTTFGLSYMKDEDMDSHAYDQLVTTLCQAGAKILSKGTAGRHNDDTGTNITWFIHFYNMILQAEFGRGET